MATNFCVFFGGCRGIMVLELGWGSESCGFKPWSELDAILDPRLQKKLTIIPCQKANLL